MRADIGDEIVIAGHVVGEARRIGQIVEVRGADGGPPYLIRWEDSGRTTLLFPGFDATIRHLATTDGSAGSDESSVR